MFGIKRSGSLDMTRVDGMQVGDVIEFKMDDFSVLSILRHKNGWTHTTRMISNAGMAVHSVFIPLYGNGK